MGNFVGQYGGDFRGVVGKRQESARNVKPAVRKREGVDGRGIEDGNLEGLVGPVAGLDQPLADIGQEALRLRGARLTAEGRHEALMVAIAAFFRTDDSRGVGGKLRRSIERRAGRQRSRRQQGRESASRFSNLFGPYSL